MNKIFLIAIIALVNSLTGHAGAKCQDAKNLLHNYGPLIQQYANFSFGTTLAKRVQSALKWQLSQLKFELDESTGIPIDLNCVRILDRIKLQLSMLERELKTVAAAKKPKETVTEEPTADSKPEDKPAQTPAEGKPEDKPAQAPAEGKPEDKPAQAP